MANKELYDYVSEATPDYSATTLDVPCQVELLEMGEFAQDIHEGDDTSEEVITYSTTPILYVELQWPTNTESTTGTIMDFFLDTAKAYGFSRSFKWDHPTDSHTYVVKFRSRIQRRIKPASTNIYGISTITLKIIGKVLDI